MEILSYRDERKCKTIIKIEVDDDLKDIEEAKRLIAEDAREQLRKYWKIEQELGIPQEAGIPLIKLFNALMNDGIYIIDPAEPHGILKVSATELNLHYNGTQFLWLTPYNTKAFWNYKKTWAFTKEELEDAKN